jgi:multimeric flavodoxin WrbA
LEGFHGKAYGKDFERSPLIVIQSRKEAEEMKVIAFNGSPKKNGNTFQALQIALEEINKEGIQVEMVQVGSQEIKGCTACGACGKNKDEKCILKGDDVNQWIQMLKSAEGMIIGSPTYFGDMNAQTKAFIDRVGYVSRHNGGMLRRKVGAAVAVNRRAGALTVFDNINHFFLIAEMVVPGANYWNVVSALKPGDILQDAEGMGTMQSLGRNMAWLMKKLY